MNLEIQKALNRGMQFFHSGRLPEAENAFREVLNLDPRDINALQLLGLTVFQMGRPKEGEKLLRKAIRRNPRIAKLHFNLGHMLDMQGKPQEALFAFREALKLDSKDEWIQVNMGIVYGKLNRLEEAVAACRAALKINPENSSALSNMGHLLWRVGKTDEAVEALERALRITPNLVEALSNLGTIRFGEKKLDQAETLLRRAYKINPHNGEVLNNLAGVLTALDKGEEALPLCRQALERNPDSTELWFNLGRVAQQAERWEEAITAYGRGLELQPDTPDAMAGLAEAHGVMGRFDEAKRLYYRVLEIKPDKVGCYAGLLGLEEREVMLEQIAKIEDLYDSAESDDEKRILAFALARFFEKEGQYEKSFNYLAEGNRLKRQGYDYAPEQDRDGFERIRSTFSEEFIQARSGGGADGRMPIFILGMPRSGTTLVEQILASHSGVFGGGELPLLQKLLERRCKSIPTERCMEVVAGWNKEEFVGLGEEYLKELAACSRGAERVTDKLPHNFLRLGLIYLALPNAKVIHCRRDPADNCLSIFKQDFNATHKYAYDLQELGGYYRLYEDLMSHWRRVLPEGFVFDLQYEQMVADQEGMTRKLLEFCGLPWEDGCLRFHETERAVVTASQAQVRRKIYSDSVKLWQRYERQLQPLIKALEAKT